MLRNRRQCPEGGFTLIEIVVATAVLVVVMSSVGPLFYGAMKLTGITNQRSQATNLAVAATEQIRSLPYSEVGYNVTPAACSSSGQTPVTLPSPGPLDTLPATTVEGGTTYTIVRCVYWSASSMPGTPEAYKQTLVKVSWPARGGGLVVSQTSALYPGGYAPALSTTTTTVAGVLTGPVSCTATTDGASPTSLIDLSWDPATGSPPSYYLVYYTTYDPSGSIPSGSKPYTTSSPVRDTATEVTVGPGTTYYFQVAAVSADGSVSSPSATCTATTTPVTAETYDSAASATALDLALGGGTVSYTVTAPAATATNDGTGSNDPVVNQPTLAVPGADSFLSAAAATEIAEANTDGTSYACAGLLSSGQSLSGGSSSSPCSVTGAGSGGVSVNLAGLPGVGTAVDTLVSGLVLNLDGAASWASGGPDGTDLTGAAYLSGASVTVTPVGGSAQTIALDLPAAITSATDLVQAITGAISASSTLASLGPALQTALSPVLTLTADEQTTANGVFSVSALHIAVLSGSGTGDMALSTVGPNTGQAATPSCSINSLVVNPSSGQGGGGVALTNSGTLADESSFQLSVNVNQGCSGVEVGYAPTGCTPGSSGCPTSYAPMTGTSGTYYGWAGTSSTVWQVGTTTFVVFTGATTTPAAYSPPTEQQVVLCTEKGTTGRC